MQRYLTISAAVVLLLIGGPAALPAQDPDSHHPIVDSIAVEGNARLTAAQIIGTAGIIVRQPINYRDIQRAITALFRTGQFDDVQVEQRTVGGKLILVIKVKERPVLERWAVRGVGPAVRGRRSRGGCGSPRDGRSTGTRWSSRGRPSTRCTTTRATTRRRSKALELPQDNGQVRVVFDVNEGERVAISQVAVDGNKQFSDETVVGHMATQPEGFWWFQKGEYDEEKLDQDLRERLPQLVRRPRLRRLPGDPGLAGSRPRGGQGGAPSDRSTKGSRTRSAPSTWRATAASPATS